jgi:hypothetical protein
MPKSTSKKMTKRGFVDGNIPQARQDYIYLGANPSWLALTPSHWDYNHNSKLPIWNWAPTEYHCMLERPCGHDVMTWKTCTSNI